MNIFESISPEFVEHEGFYYLVWEGETYKGCRRCGGEGHYSYNGEHSRCYECDNTSAKLGDLLGSVEAAEKWCHGKALRRAAADRKREREALQAQAARDARVAALKEREPEIVEMLQKVYDDENEAYGTGDFSKVSKSKFLREMASNLFNASWKYDLSENMIDALRRVLDANAKRDAERAAERASAAPVVTGRVEIQGEVVSTKSYETDYGTAYKMLVKDARGFKVYGSIPSNLWNEVELLGSYRKSAWGETDGVMNKLVGMEIKFTATVEASNDDELFGFFKRPAKAEVVA